MLWELKCMFLRLAPNLRQSAVFCSIWSGKYLLPSPRQGANFTAQTVSHCAKTQMMKTTPSQHKLAQILEQGMETPQFYLLSDLSHLPLTQYRSTQLWLGSFQQNLSLCLFEVYVIEGRNTKQKRPGPCCCLPFPFHLSHAIFT